MSNKPFLTYEQLIHKLTIEKKLSIPNKDFAIQKLKEYSYFALITGYKGPFKRKNGEYKPHTTFEDIYALFLFDDSLRSLFLKYILKIENHIKSLISYSFCEKYGDDQQEYLDATNYNYVASKRDGINNLIGRLSKLVSGNTDYPYINHHFNVHGNVPLWVIMKALTIGSVSKMYSFLENAVQTQISKEFPCVSEGMLIQMLDLLSRVRNVCAHNERLFDYRYKIGAIDDTPAHSALNIPRKNGHYKRGKRDLFAVVIVFRYLLSNDDFSDFITSLSELIDQLYQSTKMILPDMLRKYTGFPENWKDIAKSPC